MVPVAGMRVGKTAAVTGTVRRSAATIAAKGDATVATGRATAGRARPVRAGGPSGQAAKVLATAIDVQAEIVAVANRGRAAADRAAETVQVVETVNAASRAPVGATAPVRIGRGARGIAVMTGVGSELAMIVRRVRGAGVRTARAATVERAPAGARAAAMTGVVGGARAPAVMNKTATVGVTAARGATIAAAAEHLAAPAAGAARRATRRAAAVVANTLRAATLEAAAADVTTAAVGTAAPGARVRRVATAVTAARVRGAAATTAEAATAGLAARPTATVARVGAVAVTTAVAATAGRVVPRTATATRVRAAVATTAAVATAGRVVRRTAAAGTATRAREHAATTAEAVTARVVGPRTAKGRAAAGAMALVETTAVMTVPRAGTTMAGVVAPMIDDGRPMTTDRANGPGSPGGSSVGTVRRRAATASVATAGMARGGRSGAATATGAVRMTGILAAGPPDRVGRSGGTATVGRAAPPARPQGRRRPEMSVRAVGRTRGRTGASATGRPILGTTG